MDRFILSDVVAEVNEVRCVLRRVKWIETEGKGIFSDWRKEGDRESVLLRYWLVADWSQSGFAQLETMRCLNAVTVGRRHDRKERSGDEVGGHEETERCLGGCRRGLCGGRKSKISLSFSISCPLSSSSANLLQCHCVVCWISPVMLCGLRDKWSTRTHIQDEDDKKESNPTLRSLPKS